MSPNTQLNTLPSYWAEHTQSEESVLDGERQRVRRFQED